MAGEAVYVLPGDLIDPSLIPSHPTKPLKLGGGLRQVPPNNLSSTVAGRVLTSHNKNAIQVITSNGRYIPKVGDLVIGTVQRSAAEVYYVSLSDYTAPSLLPQLSFEGATKKTRPVLSPGALVHARVALANKYMDPELECVSASTGKAESLGPLVGGMLFDVSLGMARLLAMPKRAQEAKLVVLDELAAAGLRFEAAAGKNGKLWVDSYDVKTVIAVGRAVQETDQGSLNVEDQKKLVRKLIREMS